MEHVQGKGNKAPTLFEIFFSFTRHFSFHGHHLTREHSQSYSYQKIHFQHLHENASKTFSNKNTLESFSVTGDVFGHFRLFQLFSCKCEAEYVWRHFLRKRFHVNGAKFCLITHNRNVTHHIWWEQAYATTATLKTKEHAENLLSSVTCIGSHWNGTRGQQHSNKARTSGWEAHPPACRTEEQASHKEWQLPESSKEMHQHMPTTTSRKDRRKCCTQAGLYLFHQSSRALRISLSSVCPPAILNLPVGLSSAHPCFRVDRWCSCPWLSVWVDPHFCQNSLNIVFFDRIGFLACLLLFVGDTFRWSGLLHMRLLFFPFQHLVGGVTLQQACLQVRSPWQRRPTNYYHQQQQEQQQPTTTAAAAAASTHANQNRWTFSRRQGNQHGSVQMTMTNIYCMASNKTHHHQRTFFLMPSKSTSRRSRAVKTGVLTARLRM